MAEYWQTKVANPTLIIAVAEVRDPHDVLRDPLLAIAAAILVVVAGAWLLLNHLRVRELKRLAARGGHRPDADLIRPPRDIWRFPP